MRTATSCVRAPFQGDKVSLVVDVHDRLDVEQRAGPGARLRDATAAPQEHEVVDGEPLRQMQLVRLRPIAHFLDVLSLLGALARMPHEQPFAARGCKRVDRQQLALRVFLAQLLREKLGGLIGARQAARKAQV